MAERFPIITTGGPTVPIVLGLIAGPAFAIWLRFVQYESWTLALVAAAEVKKHLARVKAA
ncbi:MAG: hypothetical protein QM831_40275 [Kofleriaceae bacterium]